MKKSSFISLIAVTLLFSVSCKKESGETDPFSVLYFTGSGGSPQVGKIQLSAPGAATYLSNPLSSMQGIVYHEPTGALFITTEELTIVRINSDGTADTLYDAADGVSSPNGIAIDGNNLYWVNSGSDQIKKGSIDGVAPATTMFGSFALAKYGYGMAIKGDKIYFSDFSGSGPNGIYVGNLDGTGTPTLLYASSSDLLDGLFYPSSLAIYNNTIYWSDEGADCIGYAPLDGSGPISTLYDNLDGIDRADGLAIDVEAGKIYWSETDDSEIMRANLDGSGSIEQMLSGVESYGISLGR